MFHFLQKLREKFIIFFNKIKDAMNTIGNALKKRFPFLGLKKKGLEDHDKMLVANLARHRWPKFKQIKYLPRVLTLKEWTTAKIVLLVLVGGLLGILVSGFFLITKSTPAVGGTYTEGLTGAPKFINPLYTSLNEVDADLASLVYAGLVRIDENHQIVPDLAESWVVSENQKEYTFILRPNLKWHDGESIVADDVVFTVETIQDSEFKSPLLENFSGVKVEAVDDRTIKFTLPNSFTPFLENLTMGILPAHLWQEVVPANVLLADYNLKPVGAGPYKFKSLTKDKLGNIKAYTLERNKDYLPQPPYVKEITFKFYPDLEAAAAALKNHTVEGISFLPASLKEQIGERQDLNLNVLSLPQYTAVFFNQKASTALKDLKVRQALAYGINKTDIVAQALENNAEVIEAPILAGFVGYSKDVTKYNYDVNKAKELLEAAGWKYEIKKEGDKEVTSQWRKKNKEDLSLVLTTVNRAENFKAATMIQKFWREIGVNTELRVVEAAQIQNNVIRSRDFQVLLYGEILGIDPDPYPFWHSSAADENGLNLANFSNKEADRILEEARQITDVKQRHDKYVRFQNILAAEVPAIFLYTPKYIYPLADKIKGFDTTIISLPQNRFANVVNWYVRTKRVIK
ncbi:MAG: peptide ABC transporter substrate-binding protein [Patescibacteria group bacterium]|nr:peptide ABC transporter substrate-binding protein [Patescibacteria group bacterium]